MTCHSKLRIHLMMKKTVSYGSVYLHAHCVQITVNLNQVSPVLATKGYMVTERK